MRGKKRTILYIGTCSKLEQNDCKGKCCRLVLKIDTVFVLEDDEKEKEKELEREKRSSKLTSKEKDRTGALFGSSTTPNSNS